MIDLNFLAGVLEKGAELSVKDGRLSCRAPQGVLTPWLQQELAARKAEIIALLNSRGKYVISSFAQQRLWFLDRLEPASSAYHIAGGMRVQGRLDLAALRRTFAEVVRRHEVLRTSFRELGGRVLQVIAPEASLALPVVDLQELAHAAREVSARRIATEQAHIPFDLLQGPLLRVMIVRLDENEHLLLLTMHHIISDGWSIGILMREVTVLYSAFASGRLSPLPELPIQYREFALWQRQWLQGDVLETQLRYWKRQLEGVPAVLELPADRPRPQVQIHRGANQSFRVPRALVEALQSSSQQEDVTLFMTLLAAFQTLLFRYTGQMDIVVGSPIANRSRVEMEGLIGFFVNTLVLRMNLSGELTFRELLGRVREACLGAYAHQDLPFERLLEELQPERDLSHSPLFQVMFAFQNTPAETLRLPELESSPVEIDSEISKFDLTLSMIETENGLEGKFEYQTSLFEASTVARMAEHFQTLLEGIVAHPEACLAELPLLSAEERRQLADWNDTGRNYPRGQCVHELFEEQAERTPEAVAAVYEGKPLTYRELNQRANQLAHYLQELAIKPDMLVGLCVERSLEMIVGLLGILKAGGAYVPLEPSHPRERLAFIIADTRMSVIVTQGEFRSCLPEAGSRVICLDSDWETIAREPEENPSSGLTVEGLAYVVYTSGSMSKPKGVLVEHRQLLNYTQAVVERLDITPGMSFAMVQPLSVDSCATVIFPPLITGGRLDLISFERARNGHALADYFARERIDFLKIAPSHLTALQAITNPEKIMPRQRLVIGGEVSEWNWVQGLQALAPQCRLFNHYGPTEATVGVLVYPIEPMRPVPAFAAVPLGRPLANVQVHVLDGHLQAVPIGVYGELCIGGENLARGYLAQPVLTAERFVPNPYSLEPGRRLYRTGDLARWLPDGNLQFAGRIDDQIKIHGFRIEPSEIEFAVKSFPGVSETVVAAHEDRTGRARLVAYLVPDQGMPPDIERLRDYMKAKLPHHMIPTAFVMLEALPRTPHGKLDRRGLPVPEDLETKEEYAPPQTLVEKTIATLWQEILQVEQVGLRDDFFELGGHSLLAMRLVARIHEVFHVDLSMQQLFEAPTVMGIAEQIETVRWATLGFEHALEDRRGEYDVGEL